MGSRYPYVAFAIRMKTYVCTYILHIAAQAAIGTSAPEHRNSLLNRAFVSETDNSKQDRLFQAVRMSAVPKSKSRFVE